MNYFSRLITILSFFRLILKELSNYSILSEDSQLAILHVVGGLDDDITQKASEASKKGQTIEFAKMKFKSYIKSLRRRNIHNNMDILCAISNTLDRIAHSKYLCKQRKLDLYDAQQSVYDDICNYSETIPSTQE